jgi:hypothetical protein
VRRRARGGGRRRRDALEQVREVGTRLALVAFAIGWIGCGTNDVVEPFRLFAVFAARCLEVGWHRCSLVTCRRLAQRGEQHMLGRIAEIAAQPKGRRLDPGDDDAVLEAPMRDELAAFRQEVVRDPAIQVTPDVLVGPLPEIERGELVERLHRIAGFRPAGEAQPVVLPGRINDERAVLVGLRP